MMLFCLKTPSVYKDEGSTRYHKGFISYFVQAMGLASLASTIESSHSRTDGPRFYSTVRPVDRMCLKC